MWRAIPDLVGFYEVSDTGAVRSLPRWLTYRNGVSRTQRGVAIAPQINPTNGRLRVMLCDASHRRAWRHVHHLVLESFAGPRPDGMECRHLNGNHLDNRVVNLAWGTRVENEADKVEHGTHGRGSRNVRAKLTEQAVREVFVMAAGGARQRDIATHFNVSQRVVWAVLHRKVWRHVEVDAEALRLVVLHVAGVP